MKVLGGLFDYYPFRTYREVFVTGRNAPEDWQPSNDNEYQNCIFSTLSVLNDIINGDTGTLEIRGCAKLS